MSEAVYSAVTGHIENGWRTHIKKDGELKAMLEIYDAALSKEALSRIIGGFLRALEASSQKCA